MATASELKAQILSKAAADGEFRALLLADPKAAIAAELGTAILERFDVAVHEEGAAAAHLVLPPSPRLTEAELDMATGAANWGPFYVPDP